MKFSGMFLKNVDQISMPRILTNVGVIIERNRSLFWDLRDLDIFLWLTSIAVFVTNTRIWVGWVTGIIGQRGVLIILLRKLMLCRMRLVKKMFSLWEMR